MRWGWDRARAPALWVGSIIAFLILVHLVWPVPRGVILQGAILGGLTSLIALGIALIYRANRIVNFAQGDLGAVPTSIAVLLITSTGINYFLAMATGVVAALVLGAVVEMTIIRRFFKAPRLILTVATIGLSQVLAALGLIVPRMFGAGLTAQFPSPFNASFSVSGVIFHGNEIIALVVVPLVFVALGLFLKKTRVGVAIRGSAQSADRAFLLGIPVKRLGTLVWMMATVMSTVGLFLRAGIVGLPIGTVLGPAVLLRALAACVVGRMENFPVIAAASIGIGVIETAVLYHSGQAAYVDPIIFAIIMVALVTGYWRRSTARIDSTDASSWHATGDVRPVPLELRHLPEVRAVRWGLALALLGILVALPKWLSVSNINLASAIVIFAIIGLSLVVLTGWAGQVSLGQMAFVGIGAAVGGWVTVTKGWDLSLALLIAGLAGAVAAMVIGLPALRVRGLQLAVATLAFALATSAYFLNPRYFSWLPVGRIPRHALFGAINIAGEGAYYYLSLVGLALALVAVRGIRRTRSGRVLIAIRENERGAQAFAVNTTRTKLAAFAISGFLAAYAGCLFVHQQQSLGVNPYAPEQSLKAFSMVVIGGLGSVPGALIGALYVKGSDFFIPTQFEFLASGAGLLLVLMIVPAGLGSLLYAGRDWGLRQVAKRRGLLVPSMVADAARPPADPRREVMPEPGVGVELGSSGPGAYHQIIGKIDSEPVG
ncbi:MAG: ABC transporter permease [Acidimicrobiales bacterium]